MFATNQAKQSIVGMENNTKIVDPLTLWLIRIACLLIIIVFSVLLLGVPLLISIGQSFLNETLLSLKEVFKNLIEISLA